MKKFEGLYPALVTPFDEKGKINADALKQIIERCLDAGVDGFYVSGSTGESYLLSMDERKELLEIVCQIVGRRVEVIVNIGMFATEHSLELAKHASSMHVSAISSVPPFYFPFTMDELIAYYNELANSVDVPVIVYNIPAMSSVNFTTSDIEALFENENIIGMKHTSYDLFQLQQVLNKYPEKSVFIGHDEIFLSALSVGVKAGIGSTYNIMPEKFVKLNKCFKEGKMDEALEVQNEVNQVVDALCKVGVFKGIKAILKMQGIDCGECRKPFKPLDQEQIEELRKVAQACHLL